MRAYSTKMELQRKVRSLPQILYGTLPLKGVREDCIISHKIAHME